MTQILQVIGACVLLAAFAALQFGVIAPASLRYLVPNFVGSVALGVLAYLESQWGFLLLEVAWAGVSAWGIARALRGTPTAPAR